MLIANTTGNVLGVIVDIVLLGVMLAIVIACIVAFYQKALEAGGGVVLLGSGAGLLSFVLSLAANAPLHVAFIAAGVAGVVIYAIAVIVVW